MPREELFLQNKLDKRGELLRSLSEKNTLTDFASNDYLGLASSSSIESEFLDVLTSEKSWFGSTGSRLLTGNNRHIVETEDFLADFFDAEAALLFPSGFSANSTLLAAVAQRGDAVLYDELIHASLKEGYRLSFAEKFFFKHNDASDLEHKLSKLREKAKEIFVVTETVFSMDGDTPDLMLFAEICEKYKAHLILDEAHATGIFGESGKGLVFAHQLQSNVFARVHTFGKAVGCAGACVLGSQLLKDYLTNFGTGFIYTTAPAPLAALQIRFALNYIADNPQLQTKLRENINYFREKAAEKSLKICVPSNSAVQMIACETASEAKETSAFVRENGFDLRAILPPTARTPRLRVCLHAHNKFSEIDALTDCLQRRLSEK